MTHTEEHRRSDGDTGEHARTQTENKADESPVARDSDLPLLYQLPLHLIARIWPVEKGLAGLRVSKLLHAELSRFEIAWAIQPEVVSRQPTVLVAILGNIAHGKSTLVKALNGQTPRVGWGWDLSSVKNTDFYTHVKVYGRKCPEEGKHNFLAHGTKSTVDVQGRVVLPSEGSENVKVLAGPGAEDERINSGEWQLLRHLCLLDTSFFRTRMEIELLRSRVDAAVLVVSCNEETSPRDLAAQQLAAAAATNMSNLIIAQTKVDLVRPEQAFAHFQQLRRDVAKTPAAHAPVIPLSALLGQNTDVLAEYLARFSPPQRDHSSPPVLCIIHAEHANAPYCEVHRLQGAVLAGMLACGLLERGAELELRPGLIRGAADGSWTCRPLRTRVAWLRCGDRRVRRAVQGGIVHVGTTLDPALSRSGGLVGHLAARPGTLPPILFRVEVRFQLLAPPARRREGTAQSISESEELVLAIGTRGAAPAAMCGGKVTAVKWGASRHEGIVTVDLMVVVCAENGDKVVMSRRNTRGGEAIAHGVVVGGTALVDLDGTGTWVVPDESETLS